MPRLADLAQQVGVAVIEDAAQAHGAAIGGRLAGSVGVGCFSLYATMNVYAGEGGLISTNDDTIADRLRVLRNQGMRSRYEYVMVRETFRMTDVHAAIALPQLQSIEERTQRRRDNAATLNDGLRGVPGLLLPQEVPGRRHVWHQFTVRVTSSAATTRDDLSEALAAVGVGSAVYYPRTIPDYEAYRQHPRIQQGEFPNARRAAREVLSLPVHPWLSDGELSKIVDSVRGALRA